jgi:hypothetical protein
LLEVSRLHELVAHPPRHVLDGRRRLLCHAADASGGVTRWDGPRSHPAAGSWRQFA